MYKGVKALIARGLLVTENVAIVFDSPFFLNWLRMAVAPRLG